MNGRCAQSGSGQTLIGWPILRRRNRATGDVPLRLYASFFRTFFAVLDEQVYFADPHPPRFGLLRVAQGPVPALRARDAKGGLSLIRIVTIASLTGQLAGTVVRATGVPHDLFGGVEGSDEIFQIARRFAKFVSAREK
jgi:hypothetical protein